MKLKRNLTIAPLLLALTFAVACHKGVTAPVPGQINTFDAYAYRVLADTQAALNSFKADIAKGVLTETPTIKTLLNQAITDYNSANAVYQAWHAAGGAGSTAPVNAALGKVQSDVATISASTGGAK